MTNLARNSVRQYFPYPRQDPSPDTVWKFYPVQERTLASTAATVAWTTLDVSASVPYPASAVVLQVEWSKSGAGAARLEFRQKTGAQTLLGAVATAVDTGASQLTVPVLSNPRKRSCDYQVTGVGFGTSMTVKVIGYYK